MANYQSRYTGPEIDERLRKAGEAVLTEAQSLDADKQAQARENIGAASTAAVDGKYTKPSGGIPKADLASGVQASLGKADTAYQKPASGIPATDIAEGVIPDVSQFITRSVNDLANYYLKADTYTKDEVQQLISTIQGFSYEVVATLPAASADTMGKIYLVPSADPQQQNVKDEYITIDNGASVQARYTWEQIGSTAVDLSGYVTTQQLNTALAAYTTSTDLATLLAAKQDTIADLADIRSGSQDNIKYTQQTLTDAQKAQARTNIGAGTYSKPQGGILASDLADKYAGSPSAGGPAFKALGIPYGAVDSDSTATNIKATVDNFPETLVAGVCAYIRNDIIASASGFTLNINGTGALPVYSTMSDASRATTVFTATSTYLFVYNPTRVEGGCWDIYFGYNSDTNTIGYNLRTNGITAVAAAKFYRYRLLFTSPDGHFLIPSNTSSSTNATAARAVNQAKIDPFAPIWYYSTTTAIEANAGVSASYLWMQYSAIPLGYAFNRTGAALTMTARYPVYLKCAPQSDGSAIMDADTPIVQALPSTEDGKIYIFLGYAESATNITLYYWHPVYYFKDGAIRQWTNAAAGGGGGGGEFVLTMVPKTLSYGSSHVGNIDPAITTEAIRAAIADGKQIVLYGQFGDDDDYMRYYLQGTVAPEGVEEGESGDINELAFRTQRPYGGVFNGGNSEANVDISGYYGTDRPVFYYEWTTPAISQNIAQDKTATNKTTSPKAVADYVDGKTGDLADLDTTDKSSLVAAINEAASSGGTNSLPTGGSAGQVLAKASAADYDVEWGNIPSGGGGALPAGGTKGQTLVKQSAIDGDAVWGNLYKYGVVNQTLTWNETANKHLASNPEYGYIPCSFIDRAIKGGAAFNEATGYFELNGITDIAYGEMLVIDIIGHTWASAAAPTVNPWAKLPRTVYGGIMSVVLTNNSLRGQIGLEVWPGHRSGYKISLANSNITYFLYDNSALRRVLPVLACFANTAFGTGCFASAKLEYVHIRGLAKNVSIGAPKLQPESVAYMINNATTAAITITLHATAYAAAIADTDVQTALSNHSNVTLASA